MNRAAFIGRAPAGPAATCLSPPGAADICLDLEPPRSASFSALPLARWGILAALLLAEIALLTLWFDTTPLRERPGGDALVATSPHVLRIALAAGVATLVLAAWRRDRWSWLVGALGPATRAWPWLLLHLLAFAGFVGLTQRVMMGTTPGSPWGVGLALAWFGSAAGVAVLWFAAALSPRLWPGLVRRSWGIVLAGLAVGLGAWVVGQGVVWGWDSAATPTLWLAQQLLHLFCTDAVCRPERMVLGTAAFQVRISPACSGYEGMGLIGVFLIGYLVLWWRELRFPRALLLLPIGVALMWLANVVRIVALILIGDRVSPALALGGFHSQAGWLAFLGVALGLAYGAHQSGLFTVAALEREASASPTIAYLAPLLAIVAVQMLTTVLFNGAPLLYPVRVAVAGTILWYYRDSYGGWCTDWSWLAVAAGAGVFGLWLALEPQAPPAAAVHPVGELPAWAAVGWLAIRAAGSIITVPLAEELAFRGYLQRRLIAADFDTVPPGRFTWLSFLLPSLLFGLLHGRWLAGTLAGMAYAGVLHRRGRLADAIIAHATTNALLTGYVLLTGNWQAWS